MWPLCIDINAGGCTKQSWRVDVSNRGGLCLHKLHCLAVISSRSPTMTAVQAMTTGAIAHSTVHKDSGARLLAVQRQRYDCHINAGDVIAALMRQTAAAERERRVAGANCCVTGITPR